MPPTAGNNDGGADEGGEQVEVAASTTDTSLFAPLLSSLGETSRKVRHFVETDVAGHYADDDEIDGGDGERSSGKKGFRPSGGDGLDLLEARNTLMMSYLADLAHLVHLKLSLAMLPPRRRVEGGEGSRDEDDQDEDDDEVEARRTRISESIDACVARLDEVRVALDRVRPLERKLSHQIDRLLSMATSTSISTSTAPSRRGTGGGGRNRRGLLRVDRGDDDESIDGDDVDGDGALEGPEEVGPHGGLDALSFRPNPHALVGRDDDEDEESLEEEDDENGEEKRGGRERTRGGGGDATSSSSEEEDDEDDEDLRAAREAAREAVGPSKSKSRGRRRSSDNDDDGPDRRPATDSTTTAAPYRAPRLASVHYLDRREREERAAERHSKRNVERMRRSELLRTLRDTHGTAPEEEDANDGGAAFGGRTGGTAASRSVMERDAERERFEEETFVRLTMSRKDKRERNRIVQEGRSNLRAISDLGNLAADVAVFEEGGRIAGRTGGSGSFGAGAMDEGADDDLLRGGRLLSRGKRKRGGGSGVDERDHHVGAWDGAAGRKKASSRRRAVPKNSLQSALYGMDGGGGGGGKKRSRRGKKSD